MLFDRHVYSVFSVWLKLFHFIPWCSKCWPIFFGLCKCIDYFRFIFFIHLLFIVHRERYGLPVIFERLIQPWKGQHTKFNSLSGVWYIWLNENDITNCISRIRLKSFGSSFVRFRLAVCIVFSAVRLSANLLVPFKCSDIRIYDLRSWEYLFCPLDYFSSSTVVSAPI